MYLIWKMVWGNNNPETDAPLRTYESFIDILNDGHQTGRSPFLEIAAQMVSGVVRKGVHAPANQ